MNSNVQIDTIYNVKYNDLKGKRAVIAAQIDNKDVTILKFAVQDKKEDPPKANRIQEVIDDQDLDELLADVHKD